MEVKEIRSSLLWNRFFNQNLSPSFLQSWEWGEFQKQQNNQILRLGIFKNTKLRGIALVIKCFLKRGNFLFIPHGPIFDSFENYQKGLKALIDFLKKIAKREKFWFLRIAPYLEDNLFHRKIYQQLGFKISPIYLHAEKMWILNLDKTQEELLKEMRRTTRYLIKKGEKQGIKIEKREDTKALEIFWSLYQETVRREKFVPFSLNFIKQEFEAFKKRKNALWFLGKVNNQYLAAALIIFTKSTAFYHQGASLHSLYPVSYLLQWEAIKEAKDRGCHFYNFWGIYRPGRTPKSWQGLSLFKTGFGGQEFTCMSTCDLIYSPRYFLTYLYEKWLSFKRGV